VAAQKPARAMVTHHRRNLTGETGPPPLFVRFAMTRAAQWTNPEPAGAPRHPWLFWANGGLASGHLELSAAGVTFRPNRTSRLRGMGSGFIPWKSVSAVGVYKRQGVAGANIVLLNRVDKPTIVIMSFSRNKLEAALDALHHEIYPFPTIDS